MSCEEGVYEGLQTVSDLGFLILEIKKNIETYTSEIQHPIFEIGASFSANS
ncbi:hypothetical protein [Cellulophaga sp. BC115SP]|uniref:hypothetical protein n=1 Tax=Cellulophaga sp. BC115SP TaxID=2683263 RepID=UPI00141278BB|nr:hypothetical protein [Cellulophaga sp. BC115SP]NBB27609.1 hypothetical protein [Cellulophaga sp. BC115SP]